MVRFSGLRKPHFWCGYSLLFLLVLIGNVFPQVLEAQGLPPAIDPTGRSGEPKFPLPETPKPPSSPPALLPPVELPGIRQGQERGPVLRIFVTRIDVLGSTVFRDEDFVSITRPYENREVTTEDLEEIRRSITLLYVNKGYANSGATLPDQKTTGGIIYFQVIEGELTDIRVEEDSWFRKSYLQDRIALNIGPPFNMNSLRDRLQLLLQDQRIERINAEVKPGDRLGEARLDVSVEDANPIKVWVEFNNYQSPSVGAERGLATIAHQNLTGNGDIATITYGRSRGVDPIFEPTYLLPLNRYDTSLFFGYRRNVFEVVEQPFKPLDIESKTEIFTITLRQPVYRSLTDEVALSLTGERLYNKTTLLGDRFDFTPGADNGVATVSALRAAQEWTHRTPTFVLALRSRFSVGLDVLGATNNSGNVADSQFFAWLGQANYVTRFESTGIQWLNGMTLQVANDRLFPLEQMAVGGRYSVRGYRENTLIRDNAFLYSTELRLPLLTSEDGYDILQLAPFIDVGRAWNTKDSTPDPDTLASVGIGLRLNLFNRVNANVYWGQQLNHVPDPDNGDDLQDYGVHVQFVWNVF